MPHIDKRPCRPPAGDARTILLVEDQDDVRVFLRTALERAGFDVVDANSGASALAICQTRSGPIHLLVSDVVMPQMSGPQLAARAERLRPEMKVLFISGHADEVLERHGVADSVLRKPLTATILVRSIRQILDPPAEPNDVEVAVARAVF
jgi:DNA-binding NtrC family response regulator